MSKTKSVVFSANALSEFGDSPTCAVMFDPAEMLAEIERVSMLVKENGLTEARLLAEIEWLPVSTANDLRLRSTELVVIQESFWFTVRPKHAGYSIETAIMSIEALKAAVAEDTLVHFYRPHGSDDLEAIYEDAVDSSHSVEE